MILETFLLANAEPELLLEKQKHYHECKSCSPLEQRALRFFQDQGISDKWALATILGNIKQESLWKSNICEGGSRVNYHNCHRGGYGLIQWTNQARYNGLGSHCRRLGQNPSKIDCQLSYLVTEREWKAALPGFKTKGLPIGGYMRHAHTWLGWVVHGARTQYANDYLNRINA